MLFSWGLGLAMLAAWTAGPAAHGAEPAVVHESDFSDDGKAWSAVGNAAVTPVGRRPGGKSLVIRQTTDDEAASAWLGPVLKNPGGPLRVSLWAADNYDAQKDLSYAAAFELVACDKDGTLLGGGDAATPVQWEDKRQDPVYHHNLTVAGLRWRFIAGPAKPVAGDHLRVRLFWPKSQARGECFFTDVRVATAPAAAPAALAGPVATTGGRFSLQVGTPAGCNLFFADDPLRFEFLLATTDGQPVGELRQPVVRYAITDYERFHVASGTISFADAKPLAENTANLRLSSVIGDAAAKAVGREFFIAAAVVADGRVLAEDTVPYAVVDPRQTSPAEYPRCRFMTMHEGGGIRNTESRHERQDILAKMGTSLTHTWDYNGWPKAQPDKEGPITVPPGPEFPKMVYCPNVEQMRSMGNAAQGVPAWALMDDPLKPGRKTFDIDAYVKYIVAYIRANRQRIVQVVPAGLERVCDARTIELQRKAYAAIKQEWPDLPVGLMLWDIAPQRLLDEKLYEVADFFDGHEYVARINWKEWDDLRAELKKRGLERRRISTELACVGGTDQLQSARDQVTFTLDCHAHALDRICHFNMFANMGARPRQPILRGDYKGDGFEFMQYVDRPRVSSVVEGGGAGGAWGGESRGTTIMPLLKTVSYYNLVQNTECADFKCVFQPADRTVAYVYARDGKTICYLFLTEPNPPVTLALDAAVPYVMQDFYGRTDRVTPAGGSLVVATLDPLVLLFEAEVPALHDPKTAAAVLQPVAGGLDLPSIARGGSAKARLTLPAIFARDLAARVTATVDGTWPDSPGGTVRVAAGQAATLDLPLAVAADAMAGGQTFTTRVYDGDALVTVLKQPLLVGDLLSVELRGDPVTRKREPAVVVAIRSLADRPMKGRVRIENRYFGAGFDPDVMEGGYEVAPRGVTEVRFPVPRGQANLTASYEMRATVSDEGGFSVVCDDDVSFQASVRATRPITVDGDLGDWSLDELLPITGGMRSLFGIAAPTGLDASLYTRWNDERLFFAAVVSDGVPVVKGVDRPSWNDDNILFLIYPWTWHMGEPLNSGYYREHLGPYQGGKAGIWRVGFVPSGPANAEGAEIAVKRTATGWVYEWSYPQAALYPLEFKPGNGFRLAFSIYDQVKQDKKDENDFGQWQLLTFSGFHYSILSVPSLWRQIRLVDD